MPLLYPVINKSQVNGVSQMDERPDKYILIIAYFESGCKITSSVDGLMIMILSLHKRPVLYREE